MTNKKSIVMIGATGAVGGATLKALVEIDNVETITLLSRRPIETKVNDKVTERIVDVLSPSTYTGFLKNHTTAICTLGV